MKYRPSKEALIELNSLVSRGFTNINSPEIQNSIFYRATQTAEFLDVSTILIPPQALLLMVQVASTSPTLQEVDISGNNLGSHGPVVAMALAASHTIHTVDMRLCDLEEYCLVVAEIFAASHVINVDLSSNDLESDAENQMCGVNLPVRRINLLEHSDTFRHDELYTNFLSGIRGSLSEQTANVFDRHNNDEYSNVLSINFWMIRNLSMLSEAVINLVSSYVISLINYKVNEMHGPSECGPRDSNWLATRPDEDGISGHNWDIRRFEDGSRGHSWREPDSLLTELARPDASALETMNANNTRSQNSTIANTQAPTQGTQQEATQNSHQEVPTSLLGLDDNAGGLKVDLDTL